MEQRNINSGYSTRPTVEPWITQFIKERDVYVLRDTKTHRALNVSYSEEGLKYTLSNYGKLLFFKNAVLKYDREQHRVKFSGNLAPNPDVYVEKFIPRSDIKKFGAQITEFTFAGKALRMLYNIESVV